MEKYKFNVNFRLEKRKETNGDLIINADITFCGKRIFYYTGYKIGESQWNKTAQQVKRNNFNKNGDSATDINNRLACIRIAVNRVFANLEHDEITPTPKSVRELLKQELNEERTTRLTIIECYNILISEREEEIRTMPNTAQWTKGTLTKHKTMVRHFAAFNPRLYFEDITEELLERFEIYLISKGLSNNYVYKSMKDIKTFFNWASKKGYNKNDSYKGYKQRFKDETKDESGVNLFALSESELAQIMALKTNRSAIDRTRDMFVFCCFTGLRYSDIAKLKWCDIVDDCIDVVSKKTHQHTTIPLNSNLKNILAKYENVGDGYPIFPKISNQKYNEQLKELGKLAGLTGEWIRVTQCGNKINRESFPKYECLSSHVARRTFVTYALRCGWQPEAIRAITGHTTSKMMMNYVKMDKETKREYMSKLDNIEIPQVEEIETIFDLNITKSECEKIGIPNKAEYLLQISNDKELAILHIAAYIASTKGLPASMPYLEKLSKERKAEFVNVSSEFQKKLYLGL